MPCFRLFVLDPSAPTHKCPPRLDLSLLTPLTYSATLNSPSLETSAHFLCTGCLLTPLLSVSTRPTMPAGMERKSGR
ncbi:hypothetical protein DL93DRAFT_2089753 [Clavulina sp. PMI_390]|nr:hypothetical protein DL93DRAFT_2089753 [Clavulina sp. PMI_390]